MERLNMEEPPTRTEAALGAVWIKSSTSSPTSLLYVGLESTLKKRGISVHRGPQPPQQGAAGDAPLVVVYPPEDEEELTSGVQKLRQLAPPEAAVVVFGASADLALARAAVQAEADGFLHAGMPPKEIVWALHKAGAGQEVLPRELLMALVSEMVAQERGPDFSSLGTRKLEILELVAEGLSNAEIGQRLYISESTVKQHLRSAYKALGVKNRNQAARLLRRNHSSGTNGTR
jgi:DNA-binding NarL/FixJ family response regulator